MYTTMYGNIVRMSTSVLDSIRYYTVMYCTTVYHSVQCAPYTVRRTLYIVHCILYSVHCTPQTRSQYTWPIDVSFIDRHVSWWINSGLGNFILDVISSLIKDLEVSIALLCFKILTMYTIYNNCCCYNILL